MDLRPLSFLLHLFRADRAVPCTVGLALQTDTRPVEPLIGAVVVVAGHHIAKADVLARTIFLVVSSFVVFCLAHAFVAVGILAVAIRRSTGPVHAAVITLIHAARFSL